MDFYITDRTFNVQTIISTNGDSEFKLVEASELIKLSPSRRLSLKILFNQETSYKLKEFTKVGYYVLYKDYNGKYIWQTILSTSHSPLNGIRELDCEDASLDLLNETVPPYKADKAYPIAYYINKFTFDSGLSIGINEISKLTRKLEWDSIMTATERIESVATQFENAELDFSFEFDGNTLISKHINIYKKRGEYTNIKLYVNKDIHSISVDDSIIELTNAIEPTGGTPVGKDKPINLKGYSYKDPEGRFVLKDGILRDTFNVTKWSRTHSKDNYFLKHIRYETTNKKELLNTAIRYLKRYSVPQTTYNVDVAKIDEVVNVGDYLSLIDNSEQLYLKSRIQEINYNYVDDSFSVVLSDYELLESGIDPDLKQLAMDLNNKVISSVPPVIEINSTAPLFMNGKTADNKERITLTCNITRSNVDISDQVVSYTWFRYLPNGDKDLTFTKTGKSITIEPDSQKYYTYNVEVEL